MHLHGVICLYLWAINHEIFKRLLWNHLTNLRQISHGAFSVEGMLTICSNGSATMHKVAAMPIYGKTLHLQYLESFEAESRYTASGTQGLPSLLKWRDKVDLWSFMLWSNLCPSCCGNTGRMLHGICKYAIAVFIRWVNCGPWTSCFLFCPVRCLIVVFSGLVGINDIKT